MSVEPADGVRIVLPVHQRQQTSVNRDYVIPLSEEPTMLPSVSVGAIAGADDLAAFTVVAGIPAKFLS